jgi:hypothetical protein
MTKGEQARLTAWRLKVLHPSRLGLRRDGVSPAVGQRSRNEQATAPALTGPVLVK